MPGWVQQQQDDMEGWVSSPDIDDSVQSTKNCSRKNWPGTNSNTHLTRLMRYCRGHRHLIMTGRLKALEVRIIPELLPL